MKKIIVFCLLIASISCNERRHIESSESSKNINNIFNNAKKVEYRIDIEKKMGRPLSVF